MGPTKREALLAEAEGLIVGAKEPEKHLDAKSSILPGVPPETTPKVPVGGGLTLSVVGSQNPVAVSKELTYEIRLRNEGTDSYKQVNVTAIVPDGMLPDPVGTMGPDSTKYEIERQVIRFEPVAELRAGGSLAYRVRVYAKQKGKFALHVEVATPAIPKPMVHEAQATEVFLSPARRKTAIRNVNNPVRVKEAGT